MWSRSIAMLATILLIASGPALGRPAYRKALVEYVGPSLSKALNDCRTCHVPETEEDRDEFAKPHNPFGARLKAAKAELAKRGKATSIIARLDLVADEDSDGDGTSNVLELLAGHNPGEAEDLPKPEELSSARNILAELRSRRAAYRWAPFEPLKRPELPAASRTIRNPIDAFIAAEQEARGLLPRPEASKDVLLRRVTMDLTGLPPTPEDLQAYLADESPEAYERVVDRLLASPRHAERWARHWMDVWRYSDWAGWGMQVRDSQPHIWHWRDWIVESLQADKGYDRMLLEMLAGDELVPDDPGTLRATGYLVRNFKLLSREKWMQDVVDHTSQAFLGVTLGCARCHDHMYDPLLQKEYYQVRAIFEPHQVRTDRLPEELDTAKNGLPRAYDADLAAKTFLFLRGDDRTPAKDPLPPGVPEALGGAFRPEPVSLTSGAVTPDRRPEIRRSLLDAAQVEIETARKLESIRKGALRKAILARPFEDDGTASEKVSGEWKVASLQVSAAEAKRAALKAVFVAEELEDSGRKESDAWKAAASAATAAQRTQARCDAERDFAAKRLARLSAPPTARAENDKAVALAIRTFLNTEGVEKWPASTAYTPRTVTTYPATSTGRRLAFGRWVASRENPLTARVAVNHIWLRHFGQAIVPSVADFGKNGQAPTHPALLDWLASEFMERRWSMKAIHRLIVTSDTYRQASTPDPANLAKDPDNVYLWRMSSRRLEAESVRDCLFAVSGRLDTTMGGPEIDEHLGLKVPRRSLYFRHAAEKQMEFLRIFDGPAVSECYRRKDSVLPQQALALANSTLAAETARHVAANLSAQAGGDDGVFIASAFERLLSRSPTPDEAAECASYLASRGGEASSRESLIHVLLNHHEFVTIR